MPPSLLNAGERRLHSATGQGRMARRSPEQTNYLFAVDVPESPRSHFLPHLSGSPGGPVRTG